MEGEAVSRLFDERVRLRGGATGGEKGDGVEDEIEPKTKQKKLKTKKTKKKKLFDGVWDRHPL